ncbi:bifunctional nuclease family protein [Gemmatimonas aurantiaca]|nr:bifunctional nuclease family protein [Gemmatimonas aurantiaca]
MDMVQATVTTLALDATTKSPVVVLTPSEPDPESPRVLPIWIGHTEAWVIAMELSQLNPERPMTHDLLKTAIGSLDATVTRVEITELREQTFYAMITIQRDDEFLQIDARPSDCIAIALKCGAPIFVARDLFDLTGSDRSSEAEEMNLTNDPETLQERLRKINPEDFGNYSL